MVPLVAKVTAREENKRKAYQARNNNASHEITLLVMMEARTYKFAA
jgi:hypothetical protein